MPSRSVSSPSRPDERQHSGIPKKKKTGHKTRSAAASPGSLNLTQNSLQRSHDQMELASAMSTQNGGENISLLTTRSGRRSSGGNHSLNSTFRASGAPALTSPNGMFVLSPEQETFHSAHPPPSLDPAPKLNNSHSNATSLFCTPASTSLPAGHKDPTSTEPPHFEPVRKSTSAGVATPRGEGGLIVKKPPLRRATASQSSIPMINTSPANASLERAATPSPQEPAVLERNDTQQYSEAATASTGIAAGAAAKSTRAAAAPVAKAPVRKARTPSPQPQVPPPAAAAPPQRSATDDHHHHHHHAAATAVAAVPQLQAVSAKSSTATAPAAPAPAAAAAAVTSSPAAANLSPSASPLDPRAAAKPAREAPAKKPTRSSPPPQAASKAWVAPMNTHESPEYLPTDAPNVVVPARKFAYDVKTCTWKEIDTMIRVLHPNRGVSQGAMRVCFVVDELDERGFSTPMVAKMFRHNLEGIVEADYFNEGEAQCICGIFAEKYNKVEVPKEVDRFVISFLQCDTVRIRPKDLPEEYKEKRTGFFSYRTKDTRDIIFTMEPRLKGNFTKYTNNFGAVYEGFEQRLDNEKEQRRHKVLMAVEAFSHFTLEDSGGSMLVCDLQGVNDFLTDPQIHTVDGKGLGMGNMGQRGIDAWVAKHECNEMCRAMKLTPLKGAKRQAAKPPNVETRVSYYKILRTNLRSQAPTRPEDLIPLPKPLSEMTDDERLEYAIKLSQLFS